MKIEGKSILFQNYPDISRCYNAGMLLEKVRAILKNDCLLSGNDLMIVGISGGPDSRCLLDLLSNLHWPMIAVHFNHKLRVSADRDQKFVEGICADAGIQLVVGSANVALDARIRRRSIEEEARQARYRFLFEQANLYHAKAVAVGHNADDQVETILMHFLRGSGLAGLRGMGFRSLPNEWSIKTALIRPLLGFWRREIEEHCRTNDLAYVTDETNEETTFFRNRLRNELIPFLATYNPHIKRRIFALGETSSGDFETVNAAVQKAWGICLLSKGKNRLELDRQTFMQFPAGIQRAVIKRVIGLLAPSYRDVTFQLVQQGMHFIQNVPQSGKSDWFCDLWMECEDNRIIFQKGRGYRKVTDHPQIDRPLLLKKLNCIYRLNGKWLISLNLLEEKPKIIHVATASTAMMDADKIYGPLKLRPWKQGDHIAPFGMAGKKVKISNVWMRIPVPKRAREKYPILCDQKSILWVPGFRQAESVRITTATKQIVQVTLRQEE